MLVTIWKTVDVALIANNGVGSKGIFWICWLRTLVFVLCTEHKMIDILFVNYADVFVFCCCWKYANPSF